MWAKLDDFRFYLYAATKKEEEQILGTNFQTLLFLYLDWPLQSFFLETAEKVWHLIDKSTFNVLLRLICDYEEFKKDFDYARLFADFWNRSSNIWRESAEDPHLSKKIDEIRRRLVQKQIGRSGQN
ncbi:hypothetical protein AVEN_36349-1 [Araneus ventricosus]|uniref:Uncharacterized protein n=1 Tax=Araneus ventricosus TaxID=182803 RepID=A0A4Y2RUM8_ARAVE|nr:hypothetical protein AVEN_36349-1 [Araneus ventricosus]